MRREVSASMFCQVIDWSQNLSHIKDIWLSLVWVTQGHNSGLSDGYGVLWIGFGAKWMLVRLITTMFVYSVACLLFGLGCVSLKPISGVLCLLDVSLLLLCSCAQIKYGQTSIHYYHNIVVVICLFTKLWCSFFVLHLILKLSFTCWV